MMPNDRKFLWGEAYSTAVYLYNRHSHSKIETTPLEQLYRMKSSISHIRPWYTHALVHVPSEKQGKFDQTAEEGYLVGYTSNPTVFRIYIPKKGMVTEAKDVKFDRIRGVSLEYHHTPTTEKTDQDDDPTPHHQQTIPERDSNIPGIFPESPQSTRKEPVPDPQPQTERQPRQ